MMKITGLSHLFKWENLRNWWLTKYFFAPLYQFRTVFENENELYCQVCLHIRGICYSDRSSTVQQNDSNRTGQRSFFAFACKWCLTCAQFTLDSNETTFSLKIAILWIEGLGGILGGINRFMLKCLN